LEDDFETQILTDQWLNDHNLNFGKYQWWAILESHHFLSSTYWLIWLVRFPKSGTNSMYDDVGYTIVQIFDVQKNDEFYYDLVQIMIL
jgi:hypothetical protein